MFYGPVYYVKITCEYCLIILMQDFCKKSFNNITDLYEAQVILPSLITDSFSKTVFSAEIEHPAVV